MHILLLNDDVVPHAGGGAGVVMQNLRQGYKALGHKTTCIASHQESSRPKKDIWEDDHGTVISLYRDYNPATRHRDCLKNTQMSETLEQLIEPLNADATHVHNVHQYLTYDAIRIANKHTGNIVFTAHDVFLVAFNRVNSDAYFHSVIKNQPYKMHWWNHLGSAGRKYWPLRNRSIRTVLQEHNVKVVAVSKSLKQFLDANGITTHGVIHNGTDLSLKTSPKEVTAFKTKHAIDGPSVFFGGRIGADKGFFALCDALEPLIKDVPNLNIVVTCDNKTLNEVPEKLRQYIRPTGWLSADDMRVAHAAADVVTTPSLCLDTFNLMNIEAMAAGKPVVGTCFGGTPEVVDHQKTGYVCDPRNTDVYADYLAELLLDNKKAAAMGAAGRKRAGKYFDLQGQAKQYLEVLGY